MKNKILLICGVVFFMWSCDSQESKINLNDIQVIGSHNSYKIVIEPALWDIINTIDSQKAKGLQYGHISIVKHIEF